MAIYEEGKAKDGMFFVLQDAITILYVDLHVYYKIIKEIPCIQLLSSCQLGKMKKAKEQRL